MSKIEGNITITKEEYVRLMTADEKLSRLEGWGVDNWQGYGDALNPEGEDDMDTFKKKLIESLKGEL